MLPKAGKVGSAAGKDFMGIRLMPDVPNHPVLGRVEDIVNGDGEFHGTQARRQVSAGARYHFNNQVADFSGKLR